MKDDMPDKIYACFNRFSGEDNSGVFSRNPHGQRIEYLKRSHVDELIEQAFMAGQADCGIDPSYSGARMYAVKALTTEDK